MTRDDAVRHILASGGEFFGVEFTKRTTGETRQMNARLGVTKHLKGGERAYDPVAKGLIVVYDLAKKGYRSIPTEAITRIVVKGQWVDVTDHTPPPPQRPRVCSPLPMDPMRRGVNHATDRVNP